MTKNLFSIDAENAVLSSILKNPQLINDINGLKMFMFSAVPNQVLFSEMIDIASKNSLPDAQLILSSAEANKTLEQIGGKTYIDFLSKLDTKVENFRENIGLVVKAYKARSLLTIGASVKSGDITADNIDDKIYEYKNALETLSSESNISGAVHISEGLPELYKEIIARQQNPGIRGTPWGIRKIDDATGGRDNGDLWYLCGRPGQGKTALACNAILQDGAAGNPCLMFSKEMNYTTLAERLIGIDSGVSISDIRLGLLNQEKLDKISDSIKKIKRMPIFVETTFIVDEYYIENTIKKFYATHGIKTAYIDYIQLIAERDDDLVHTLGRISRMLKLLANHLNMSVVALSQLNRKVEMRDNKRPIMSDMRDSGNLEEDADLVIGLYRDDYYYKEESQHPDTMEYLILKNRNGPTGSILLDFDPETNKVK